MKKLALLAVLALVPASYVLAQSSIDDEINAELDRMYQRSRGQSPSIQVNVQTNPTASANPVQTSDQNQKSGMTTTTSTAVKNDAAAAAKNDTAVKNDTSLRSIQKQPVTVIEASPLSESQIDRIRKARQDEEMRTEQSLAERLELSRIQDERRRAEALFGDRFGAMTAQQERSQVTVQSQSVQTQSQQAIVAPVPVAQPVQQVPQQAVAPVEEVNAVQQVIVAPVAEEKVKPVVIEQPEVVEASAPAAESKMSLSDLKKEEKEEVAEKQSYFSGLVGMGNYNRAENVRGNYALGFSVGSKIKDRFLVEGAFSMANYDVEQLDSGPWGWDPMYPRITEMNQYSLGGLAKYQLMSGTVRPAVGGLLSYSYRTFNDKQLGFENNDASSHALDMGLVLGLDLEISQSMAIGIDYRYMFNLWNRASNSGFQTRFSQSAYGEGTAIEKFNYELISIVGRFTF